jgi:serine/threonine protein kinase/formylglycine-generating enzyme required for sulfatase activity
MGEYVADGRISMRPDGANSGARDTGARIGRYVVLESVGTGAMGVVYGAYDPELDRKIALKLIKPGQGAKAMARERLLREAKAMARLQHPNVVAVHDVGVYEDQVFLAMEFLAAGTIKDWLKAKPRTWREILDVFIAAGRGLAAAHEAGIVHRDFKPENVLLDNNGRPRVVDFGIARQAEGRDDDRGGETLRPDEAAKVAEALEQTARLKQSSGNVAPLLTLTKTGTWVGTPAYMAPEQFLGERGDEKSDQFSFCVALYEALYGERPFAGDDMLSLSVSVTTEHLRPMPKDRGVPAWIRRVIMRGLKAAGAARWPSMSALIAALENDPAVKLRRGLTVGGAVAVVAVVLLVAWQMASRRRLEVERQIAKHIEESNQATLAARGKAGEARALRTRALAAFDAMDRDGGETLWRQTRSLIPAVDAEYDRAEHALERGIVLDQDTGGIRKQLSDVRYEHLEFAEDFRMGSKAVVLQERLAGSDAEKRKQLAVPGMVTLRFPPRAAGPVPAALERFETDPATGRRVPRTVGRVSGRDETLQLPPGSYRTVMEGSGLASAAHVFEVRRGEHLTLDVTLPPVSSVPDGFIYVPAGESWFGDASEQLRTQFLNAVPMHRRRTDAFLIARHETTYADWIAFLDSFPPGARARHAPDVSTAIRGTLRLRETGEGWQLSFQPTTERYTAMSGSPIVYVGRKQMSRQDWLRFPVAGISPRDAAVYTAWLRSTGRVPGARLCTEVEWERAARGADDRVFPHGDELLADDANFDLTYGRVQSAYGPDIVGAHSGSRSPFGIDDLAGNAFEFAVSSQRPDEFVIRGGAYYYGSATCLSTNREVVAETFRDPTAGLRVCASVGKEPDGKNGR